MNNPVRLLAALVIAAALLVAVSRTGSAHAATPQHKVTIYSVATLAQFINHQDDRQRAVKNSPFTGDLKKVVPQQKGDGPFPGDSTIYSFNLFTSANLKKKAGTAVYTCHYNFVKHALCTATFALDGGTLLAAGPVDFNSTHFTLAVTGGTIKYIGANGQVAMSPLPKNTQRLEFVLLGS